MINKTDIRGNNLKYIPNLQSAHSILLFKDLYILQLRDVKANIAAPGQWSLFGGRVSEGETPLKCIKREIYEELIICPYKFNYLWYSDYMADFENKMIRSWFFTGDVTEIWKNHKLMEGQDAGMFKYEEIKILNIPLIMKETIGKYESHKFEYT
ncbi:MAG: hypothetical protein A2X48_04520 [Lentisphaerae bacterium GWF2_49_21]|nr:MAG: hypothetical protein A2X48_04520 [Lentisphaerae bacterium GWF2_49_21]